MRLLESLLLSLIWLSTAVARPENAKRAPGWQSTTQWWTPAPTTQWWTPAPTTQWWTPAPTTQWWYPTSSYQSVWVGTSTSTVYVYITQQANVVVTMTSYIPCVVTSTVWVYQCQGGCPTTPVQQYPTGAIGSTVTITSYAQVTAGVALQTRTVTSGSYVLAIIEAATSTANVPGTGSAISAHELQTSWLTIMLAASVFCLMVWL